MAFGTPMVMNMLDHRMHLPHRNRDTDTEPFPRVPSIEIMSASGTPTNPSTSSFQRQNRDTGFPEPFNGDRNTTLPYPGADLSPNARITMDDGLLNADPFSNKRSFRRSRLNKHKRTVSYGKITPQFEAPHSVVSIVDATAGVRSTSSGTLTRSETETSLSPSAPPAASAHPAAHSMQPSHVPQTPMSASFSSPRTSREETDSFRSKREDETPPSSPESHSSRKEGFMQRWRSLSRG